MAKYKVLNPNSIPKGVAIMHFKGKDYFEGDEFEPPAGMKLDRILREGFVVEVKV